MPYYCSECHACDLFHDEFSVSNNSSPSEYPTLKILFHSEQCLHPLNLSALSAQEKSVGEWVLVMYLHELVTSQMIARRKLPQQDEFLDLFELPCLQPIQIHSARQVLCLPHTLVPAGWQFF